MMCTRTLAFISIILFSQWSFAASFLAQGRLFATVTHGSAKELNTEMTAQGLKEFGKLGKLGVEITYAFSAFEIGFSYAKRNMENDETVSTDATSYKAL